MSNRCWACPNVAMPAQLVCELCFKQTVQTKESDTSQVLGMMKKVFSASSANQRASSLPDGPGPSGAPLAASAPFSALRSDSSKSDSDLETEGFDFSLVQKRRYFKHVKKDEVSFPFMEELRDLIWDEWGQVENKASLKNNFSKLYPFKKEDVKVLEEPPVVYVALMRLARHVMLPLDDAVSFRDVLDRCIDLDLKKIYLLAGGACKPAVAMATISKALEAWIEGVESAVSNNLNKVEILDMLKNLKLSSAFFVETSLDVIKSLSRTMLASVTGRRALWLRPCIADPSSRQGWCKIPFEGQCLFGNKLDMAIAMATGGR